MFLRGASGGELAKDIKFEAAFGHEYVSSIIDNYVCKYKVKVSIHHY